MKDRDVAIKVENVSKIYRIGLKEQSHDSLGRSLLEFARSPLKNYRKYRSLYEFGDLDVNTSNDEEDSSILWAVRDLSFEIERGSVVGIIGTNGAGKSTLLKMLSKITPPTRGMITIKGRVSSLLEVGTGFHKELTGRENVFLNGTVLGMRKKEIDRKFDEIVDFSGVEKFLDTPVKRYSSGMRIRLAFAVAAYLEPEILIIDEVLAVGDAAFQRKCLNKMQDVGKEGRTVLFVSHNMPAITRLCERVILLNEGRLIQDGTPHDVINTYLNEGHGIAASKEWRSIEQSPGDDAVRLRAVRIISKDGVTSDAVDIRQPVGIEMTYDVLESGRVLMPYYNIGNDQGVKICTAIDQDSEWRGRARPEGRYVSTAWIPGNLLSEGIVYVGAVIRTTEPNTLHCREREIVAFHVIDSLEGDSVRGDYAGDLSGVIRPALEWNTKYEPLGDQVRSKVSAG